MAEHPRRYAGLSLRDLCDQMHAELRALQNLDRAFPGSGHDIHGVEAAVIGRRWCCPACGAGSRGNGNPRRSRPHRTGREPGDLLSA